MVFDRLKNAVKTHTTRRMLKDVRTNSWYWINFDASIPKLVKLGLGKEEIENLSRRIKRIGSKENGSTTAGSIAVGCVRAIELLGSYSAYRPVLSYIEKYAADSSDLDDNLFASAVAKKATGLLEVLADSGNADRVSLLDIFSSVKSLREFGTSLSDDLLEKSSELVHGKDTKNFKKIAGQAKKVAQAQCQRIPELASIFISKGADLLSLMEKAGDPNLVLFDKIANLLSKQYSEAESSQACGLAGKLPGIVSGLADHAFGKELFDFFDTADSLAERGPAGRGACISMLEKSVSLAKHAGYDNLAMIAARLDRSAKYEASSDYGEGSGLTRILADESLNIVESMNQDGENFKVCTEPIFERIANIAMQAAVEMKIAGQEDAILINDIVEYLESNNIYREMGKKGQGGYSNSNQKLSTGLPGNFVKSCPGIIKRLGKLGVTRDRIARIFYLAEKERQNYSDSWCVKMALILNAPKIIDQAGHDGYMKIFDLLKSEMFDPATAVYLAGESTDISSRVGYSGLESISRFMMTRDHYMDTRVLASNCVTIIDKLYEAVIANVLEACSLVAEAAKNIDAVMDLDQRFKETIDNACQLVYNASGEAYPDSIDPGTVIGGAHQLAVKLKSEPEKFDAKRLVAEIMADVITAAEKLAEKDYSLACNLIIKSPEHISRAGMAGYMKIRDTAVEYCQSEALGLQKRAYDIVNGREKII